MDCGKTNIMMMEYFTSGETDNFSLQDMIESDIKSDFEDHLMKGTSGDFDVFNAPEPVFSFPSEASTESSDLGAASGIDCHKLGDLSWLQTVNLTAIKPENTDPNLLVNPQTGLPTPRSTAVLITSNRAEDAAGVTTIHQPQIVHIKSQASPVSPMSPTPMSPVLQQTVMTSQVPAQTVQPAFNSPTTISLALSSPPLQAIQNTHTRQIVSVQTQPSLTTQLLTTNANKKGARIENGRLNTKVFPKPVYSYSCLIAMALKNSENGALPVSEIYSFMTENFPYFKTAPDGWKNSVRHNLSLNKCFEKIENPRSNGNTRKGCLWGLNPEKIEKMDEEIAKWRKKDPLAIKRSMAKPEVLELLEKGNIGSHNIPVRQKQAGQTLPSGVVRVQNIANKTVVPSTIHITNGITSANIASPLKTITAAQCASPSDIQISMVEITPADPAHTQANSAHMPIKQEVIKMEEGLSSDDLAIIDTALNLDPNLNDINMQHSIWDDLSTDIINFDDFPMLSGPGFNIATLTNGLSTPAQAASGSSTSSPLISLLTSAPGSGVKGHTVSSPSPLGSVTRTISAQT